MINVRDRFERFAIYLVALVSCLPLVNGFPAGHDWGHELVRVAEYAHALGDGQFPPYWASNLYTGYGSPIFLFYAPLFVFLASAASIVTGSVPLGASATIITLTLLSAFFIEQMTRAAFTSDDAPLRSSVARVAAYLYLLNPYLVSDKLLRNASAEFTALCIAPLALWGVFALRKTPRRGVALLAAGVFLTILAHNLTALVMIPVVVLAALAIYSAPVDHKLFVLAGAGAVLGLLMAAFFWLPVLVLMPEVQIDVMTRGIFDFHRNFQTPEALFGYGFQGIGAWPAAVAVLGMVVAWRLPLERVPRRIHYGGMIGVAMFLFLQTPPSVWIWENAPLLPLFQFPWRFMGPLALFLAFVGAMAFGALAIRLQRFAVLERMVLALSLANVVPHLIQYEPLPPAAVSHLRTALSAGALKQSYETATVLDEYLPIGASGKTPEKRPPVDDPILGGDPPVLARVLVNAADRSVISVIADQPSVVHLARWAFPVWNITVNGVPTPMQASPLMTIDVPVAEGSSEIAIELHPPSIRSIGLAISACGLLAWVVSAFRFAGRSGS